MSTEKHGRCLCGKVKITAPLDNPSLGACHCNTCRKWSAGPFMSIGCNGKVELGGEEYVKYYDSSEWAQRAFCGECGTSLFYKLKGIDHYYLAAWVFDDLGEIPFESQVYIDCKPENYHFVENTQNLTEADILALFNT